MKNKINISRLYLLLAIAMFFVEILLTASAVLDSFYGSTLIYRFLINQGVNILINFSMASFLLVFTGFILLFDLQKHKGRNKKFIIIGIILYIISFLIGSLVIT